MSGGTSGGLTLRARQVVPIAGPPIENGWLRIDRGRIAEIGSGTARVRGVDLGEAIVLAGLVNAHTHLEFSSLDEPLAGDGGLPGWIARIVAVRRGRSPGADESGRAVALGLAECAACGVTAIGEIATAIPSVRTAVPSLRIRMFREALGLSPSATRTAATMVERDVALLAAGGAAAGVSPHAPYSVAAALGRRVLADARRLGLPAAMHLAESPEEAELIAHGSGPFRQLLESLGAWPDGPPHLLPAADWISLLARGPRGIVVHGTFLDDTALARLARHRRRLAAVICPRTTRRLAGILPPLARFRAAGIRVALGTDSRASNPDLSVLGECRTLVDAGLASPAEAIRMATIEGAWALGFERKAGILAPGRPADLVVLRPAHSGRDPFEAALDPATKTVATLRSGTVLHGSLSG